MVAQLTKKILEQEDVKAIQPNFTFVKYLPKEISEKAQTVVFDGDKNHLQLITTNVNSLAVKSIIEQLTAK